MTLRNELTYLGRHFTPSWRYLFNFESAIAYYRNQHQLNVEAATVVADLNLSGIAVRSIEHLLGGHSLFLELSKTAEGLLKLHRDQIAQARDEADCYSVGHKSYLIPLLGEKPLLDLASIYARFSLHPEILAIANAYFQMYTQLRYYNIWHTVSTKAPARESQLWHFDREDHFILKIFLYLSDIDEGAGPFTYAPGTHIKRRQGFRLPDAFIENGIARWNDEQMEAEIPVEQWIRVIGPPGTIIFADTRGYHKGGLARSRDRTLFTCLFTSPASQAPELFDRSRMIQRPTSMAQARALAL